jgi:hypothetical protein
VAHDELHLAYVSIDELWRLLGRFQAEIGAELDEIECPPHLRKSYRRSQDVIREIRLRGIQLALPESGQK